jgi:site-specific DNA-methyltransferase (adenine-specific)
MIFFIKDMSTHFKGGKGEMKPYFKTALGELYHGDCLEIMPQLPKVDLVLTDPPYGINANRMTLGLGKKDFYRGSEWDSHRPNISWMLERAKDYCIWGGNYFADQLPINNDILVWWKLNDGRSFSECEFAWTNSGKQVRMLRHHWGGEQKKHPTQKPTAVISWCLTFFDFNTVIDPFLGSGTTAVACERLGRRWIGIELEEKYCEIAAKRIEDEAAQLKLFS